MSEILSEQVFRVADGSYYRVQVTRSHPTTGRFVPGVRFFSFQDMEGKPIGVAGVNPVAAVMDLDSSHLERLLTMAGRCSTKAPRS